MDEIDDSEDLIPVPATIEFYLKGRDDPYEVVHEVGILRPFVVDADPERMMAFVVNHLDEIMTARNGFRAQFRTPLGGVQSVVTDEVQAWSVSAITEETIQRALEAFND